MPDPIIVPDPKQAAAPESSPSINDVYSEIERMSSVDGTPTEVKPKEDVKPKEAPAAKPDDKVEPKVEAKPEVKPEEKKLEQPPLKTEKAKTLRESRDQWEKTAKDWESKYKILQSESAKPKDDPEKATLLKEKENWTKRDKEREEELRYANYERSQEYKEKYQMPFFDEYENGKSVISSMTIKEPDVLNELGEIVEQGKSRKATAEDWEALMSITNEDAANKFITEKFGYNAAKVTLLRDKVLALHNSMQKAKADYRKTGVERERTMAESTKKNNELIAKTFNEDVAEGVERFPKFLKAEEGNEKEKAILEEGTNMAKLAFGILDAADVDKLSKWIQERLVDGKLPPREQIKLHSAVFNMFKASNLMHYRNTVLTKENEQLRKDLAEYEESEPKKGEVSKVEQRKKSGFESAADMIDRMAAGNA